VKDPFTGTTLPLAVVGGLNLIIGLLFQAVVVGSYGASGDLDAFFMANALPGFLNNWLLWGAANIVLVPLLCSRGAETDPLETRRIVNTFITALGLMSLATAVLFFLLAPYVVPVLAPGFDPGQVRLCIRILQLLSVTVFFSAVVSLLRGILNAERIFLVPYAFVTVYHLFLIGFVLTWKGKMGIWALAAGTVLASVILCLLHFIPLRKVRFRFRIQLEWSLLRGPLKLFFAYMLVGMASQINFVADRYFASRLPEGSIVILSLAQKFQVPIIFLFAFAVSVPALTFLSSTVENREKFCGELRNSIRHLTVLVLPFLALLLALRLPLARLWLQHGAFTHADVLQVGTVLLWLSFAFLVNAYSSLQLNGFFVLKSTALVIVVVFAESALNILLNHLLVGPMGLNGIALATGLSTAPANILLWGVLRSRLKGLGFRSRGEVVRLVLYGAACFPLVFLCGVLFSQIGIFPNRAPLLYIVLVTAVSLPGFLALGLLFRIEEILALTAFLKNRLRGDPASG